MSSAIHIRLAGEADLSAINAIYNHYVTHSTCTYQIAPETAVSRHEWFQKHDAAHPVTVAEVGGEIAGWGALHAFHSREAFARTVEDSVYVRPDLHRRGIGHALLADLIERACALGHHTIIAGVSAEQAGSIRLHERLGFVERGRMHRVGYKHAQWLDLVLLQRMLD